MSKNVMLLFKLKLFIQKNMLFYLFSHIALSPGLWFVAYPHSVGTNPRLLKFIPSGESDYLN